MASLRSSRSANKVRVAEAAGDPMHKVRRGSKGERDRRERGVSLVSPLAFSRHLIFQTRLRRRSISSLHSRIHWSGGSN